MPLQILSSNGLKQKYIIGIEEVGRLPECLPAVLVGNQEFLHHHPNFLIIAS
jgi:hypothetical protein